MFKKGQKKYTTNKGKVLTAKQLMFCKHYLANGFNASKATLSAGYSPATHYKHSLNLMRYPLIKEYLKKRMEEVEKKLDITFEQKMELLWKSANRCYGPTDEEMQLLKKGMDFKPTFSFEPSALVSSINELNKMQGHHATPKTITLNVDADTSEIDSYIKKFEREY